ncbi:heavy-metal-associated domain-containing protein [Mucisphaera calidilacus]|uniref:Copper chaperone CopZ n=1 Tax=Mucisphaera calidilacus TaxID=2527982 RepID=A0A518BTJ8_9BACT|nr:heavy-metal-associated domain-containing protein [Mucisphaera calidilacus]QDU70289.1 Copper chaperone CopZ [Mucisphaera calidilacus]
MSKQNRLAMIVLSASLLLIAGCSTAPQAASSEPTDGHDRVIQQEQVTLYALGLSCPLCSSNLDKSMLEVEGVKAVKVNLADGQVVIDLDPDAGVTVGELIETVEASGFTVDRVELPQM